jgi:hypothetical protein
MKAVGFSGPWAVMEQKRLEAEAKNVGLKEEASL